MSCLPRGLEPHVRNQSNTDDRDREGFDVSDIIVCTKPAHPDPKFIVVQKRAKSVLSFKQKWFTTFPWLHYSATLGVLCFHCALFRFSGHAESQVHFHAMNIFAQKGNTVASKLSSAAARQQEEPRYGLSKIAASIKYLAQQGLALPGHVGIVYWCQYSNAND